MKKILSILLMITCVLGLTACGGNVENLKYDETEIKAICSILYDEVSAFSAEDLATLKELNDDDLDSLSTALYQYTVQQEGTPVKISGQAFVAAIDSWQSQKEILGTTTPTGNVIINAKPKELTVKYEFTGTVHDGSIDFVFDRNLHVTSITANPKYDMSESMQKAGINTLVGMGTVFVMLIVIMIIITLLGAVCNIGKGSKKEEKAKDSVDKAIEQIVKNEEIVNETDDLELVAVISAAIAAAEGTSSIDGFVVRSIRRIR